MAASISFADCGDFHRAGCIVAMTSDAASSRAADAAAVRSLLDRRLLIVTGKGGVGKSTVAGALGLIAASQGKRVLLCEFDAKGDLLRSLDDPGRDGGADRFKADPARTPLAFVPREIHPNLWAMAMDPEESLREYLRINLRLPFVSRIGLLSKVFDFLANAAPGVREIVTIGKVAYDVRERSFDIVVVDATSTGHIIGQLRAPQAINELVGVGLIQSQTSWMLDLLGDEATTGVVLVTTLEEMPVTESLELLESIRTLTNVSIAGVVANRVLPGPFTRREEALFSSFRKNPETLDPDSTVEMSGHLLDGVALIEDIRAMRAHQLSRLIATTNSLQVALVPELFSVATGLPTTQAVGDQLTDELGL